MEKAIPTAQLIEVNLDLSKQRFVDSNGFNIAPIQLFTNSQVVFRVSVFEDNTLTTPVDLSGESLLWGIDSSYITQHPDLIVVTSFQDTNDWSEADLVTGKICWRVNLGDGNLLAFMGDNKSKTVYSDLWVLANDPQPAILLHALDITINNYVSSYINQPS